MKNIKNIEMLLSRYITTIEKSDTETYWENFNRDSRKLYMLAEREEKEKELAIKRIILNIGELLESMSVLIN